MSLLLHHLYVILFHWAPTWPSPTLAEVSLHVGLVNPHMVVSSYIREYMKSWKRRKMVKALRNTLK